MKRHLKVSLILWLTVLFLNFGTTVSAQKKHKNEVLVLGTIHSGHLTDPVYNINYLKKLIKKINPDFILTEIPPDRFDEAMRQFKQDGVITEPRVKVFPEYVNVIFPLTKEMKFEIIPTAGWTKFMNDEIGRASCRERV